VQHKHIESIECVETALQLRIDLHGPTSEEAYSAYERLVNECNTQAMQLLHNGFLRAARVSD